MEKNKLEKIEEPITEYSQQEQEETQKPFM